MARMVRPALSRRCNCRRCSRIRAHRVKARVLVLQRFAPYVYYGHNNVDPANAASFMRLALAVTLMPRLEPTNNPKDNIDQPRCCDDIMIMCTIQASSLIVAGTPVLELIQRVNHSERCFRDLLPNSKLHVIPAVIISVLTSMNMRTCSKTEVRSCLTCATSRSAPSSVEPRCCHECYCTSRSVLVLLLDSAVFLVAAAAAGPIILCPCCIGVRWACQYVDMIHIIVTGLTRQCLPMAHSSQWHTASTASSIPHHQYTPSPNIYQVDSHT
jgi:hypothetical protein